MTNKPDFHRMVNEMLKGKDFKSEEEAQQAIAELINDYNTGKLDNLDPTPLDEAYELLEKAENATTRAQAEKLAKQAYAKTPQCFDAWLFLVELESNTLKQHKLLDRGLKQEKERLMKEDYFDGKNIGHFHGIFETRAYLRGLYEKIQLYLLDGRYRRAEAVCKEIIHLNENDNLGTRYILMALYALLEEEKPLLALFNKYEEESLHTLLPMAVLYYKQENYLLANQYLMRMKKANPHIITYFKNPDAFKVDAPQGYFSPGGSSEVVTYLIDYYFLMETLHTIGDFILS